MNYFEFYGLPLKFTLDSSVLRQKFFELSKLYHPDFFVNENEELKQDVLSKSTFNNNAFKTLSNDTLRVKYILELTATLSSEEKEILPQDFLLEMMDLNEAILESDEKSISAIKENVAMIENQLKKSLAEECHNYDTTTESSSLHRIKLYYLKQKYLLRIKESMLKFAAL